MNVVPFDLECAKILGSIKHNLRKIGKPTGEVDAMIAAVSIGCDAILITANKKHFENIQDLKLDLGE